jgi:hypothetical protein
MAERLLELDVRSLCQFKGILNVDTEITDRVVDLDVPNRIWMARRFPVAL